MARTEIPEATAAGVREVIKKTLGWRPRFILGRATDDDGHPRCAYWTTDHRLVALLFAIVEWCRWIPIRVGCLLMATGVIEPKAPTSAAFFPRSPGAWWQARFWHGPRHPLGPSDRWTMLMRARYGSRWLSGVP